MTIWAQVQRTLVPGAISESVVASEVFSVGQYLSRVDQRLADVMIDMAGCWFELPDNEDAVEILGGSDLPMLLRGLLMGGGKRLRPIMSALGWLAAGGRVGDRSEAHVVTVGAALELLHVFALVHDDVMDESASRRGKPSVHAQAARLHEDAAAAGSAQRFGESIAILVGDLAHAEAGHLVAELPMPMRRVWRSMVAELVAGQRRDLVGCARGSRDLEFARSVARMKSGRYSVERPLQLGAVAAGAPDHVADVLADYGRAVGEAFALRDDLLGIWGDPVNTGKPAGDDLISGKPTVILALAETRIRSSHGRAALDRVGTPQFGATDLEVLREQLQSSGVSTAVEDMIGARIASATRALQDDALNPDGVRLLTDLAMKIGWRDR